jgi:hypothetical protein
VEEAAEMEVVEEEAAAAAEMEVVAEEEAGVVVAVAKKCIMQAKYSSS